MEKEYLTVRQVAEKLGVSRTSVFRYIRRARVETKRLGPMVLVPKDAIPNLQRAAEEGFRSKGRPFSFYLERLEAMPNRFTSKEWREALQKEGISSNAANIWLVNFRSWHVLERKRQGVYVKRPRHEWNLPTSKEER